MYIYVEMSGLLQHGCIWDGPRAKVHAALRTEWGIKKTKSRGNRDVEVTQSIDLRWDEMIAVASMFYAAAVSAFSCILRLWVDDNSNGVTILPDKRKSTFFFSAFSFEPTDDSLAWYLMYACSTTVMVQTCTSS